MFFGEALCYIIFQIYKKINSLNYETELQQAKYNNLKIEINQLRVLILSACDLITSSLSFVALELMPPSVYSTVHGANIIVTALFQVIFLKRKIHLYQIIGMIFILTIHYFFCILDCIFIGNLIVGVSVFIQQKNDSGSNEFKLVGGIILLILSFITFSYQKIFQEIYFKQYYLNPFQLVGLEGIWGILLTSILLIILQFTPCPSSFAQDCPHNNQGKAYFEQTDIYFEQLFSIKESYQPQLGLAIFAGVVAVLLFNALSASVIKYLSALTNDVVQVSTIVVVWLSCLWIGWEKFIWGQLMGFFILTLGSLIYGTIVQLSFAPLPKKDESLLSKVEDEISIQEKNQNRWIDENQIQENIKLK